ncbi:cobalamin biosynthesis protein CbiX [Kitasatospora sp. NBC_01250]|uniref:cobalamin biosynthesis protein CbiX n=1 Tax=Kitasatospora sp. NBC_01250 TaxID=2903571 RepID=UPI002E33B1F3|nr:cobalamin biosynthesis protein CbiX [Kitasatospora sp. NBC_01250]
MPTAGDTALDPAAARATATGAATGSAGEAALVLVGGHESGGGERLRALAGGRSEWRAVGPGRALAGAVAALLAQSDRPVCVVPMSLGRDPRLIADTARTLRWLSGPANSGRLALAEPFGGTEHLIGWLRGGTGRALAPPEGAPAGGTGTAGDGAAGEQAAGEPTAILLTAPAAGPFEDAELFRIARLVRQYRTHRWVEVAFENGDPSPAEGVERCRLLGARRVVLLPAAFGAAPVVPGAEDGGPLLSSRAVAGVLRARAAGAVGRLLQGVDGIAAGLDAEHGHGFPHSHNSLAPHRH